MTALTDADHERFLTNGFLLLEQAVPPEAVAEALALFSDDTDESHSISNDAKDAAAMACVSAQLLTAVNELLGEKYAVGPGEGAPSHLPRKHTPDAEWSLGAHMDLIHPTLVPDYWAVGAFIYLTDVRTRAGAFMYGPGSPLRMRAQMSRFNGESAWGAVVGNPDESDRLIEFLGRAGDAILFQHPMVHSASPNIAGPDTRHAIRVSFPVRRLGPDDCAFEAMSTIEKANSPRWLRARYGDEFSVLEPATPQAELANGFGPVEAHDLIHYDGAVLRYWVTPEEPTVVQRATSTDLARWESLPELRLAEGSIAALHLEQRFDLSLTIVERTEAGVSSRVYRSPDGARWEMCAKTDGAVLSRPHYVGPFMARTASRNIVYETDGVTPGVIRWRSGEQPADVNGWTEGGEAHRGAGNIEDMWSRPGKAMYAHVLVADVDGAAHYTISAAQDGFPAAMTPFTSSIGTPRRIRCLERTQGLWLVTFTIDQRVFWGVVDWAAAPGVITRIEDVESLQRALATVGLA